MRITKRLAKAAVALASVLFLGPQTTVAQPSNAVPDWSANDLIAVQRCAGFMLMGRFYDGIRMRGDGFDCHPLSNVTVLSGGVLEVRGRVSRRMTAMPDNEYYMTLRFMPNGDIREVRTQAAIVAHTDTHYSLRIDPVWRSLSGPDLIRAIAREYPGSGSTMNWRHVGAVIASFLAVELARSQRDRENAPVYYFDRPGSDLRQFEMRDGGNFAGQHVDSRFPNTYLDTCVTACNQEAACRAWTVTRPNGGRQPICYLKGGGTQPRLDHNAISGVRPMLTRVPRATIQLQPIPR